MRGGYQKFLTFLCRSGWIGTWTGCYKKKVGMGQTPLPPSGKFPTYFLRFLLIPSLNFFLYILDINKVTMWHQYGCGQWWEPPHIISDDRTMIDPVFRHQSPQKTSHIRSAELSSATNQVGISLWQHATSFQNKMIFIGLFLCCIAKFILQHSQDHVILI